MEKLKINIKNDITYKNMKKYIIENTFKNIIILILLTISYHPIQNSLRDINSENYGNILIACSILVTAVLFADYTFTYMHANLSNCTQRYLGHLTTFIAILSTGFLLESITCIFNLMTGKNLWIINGMSIMFFVSLIMYDFWDLLQNKH